MNCEICKKLTLKPFFNLGAIPLADEIYRDRNKSINQKKYKVEILICKSCKTLYQKKIVNKKKLFHKNYHYRARFTNDVLNGMQNLVHEAEKICGKLKGKKILDIGCNDGSLLNFFYKKGALTYGIEPTNAFKDASKKHTIYNKFFDKKNSKKFLKDNGPLDIIVFTNVFAHIENLDQVIKSLKILCNEKTFIIIENHYLLSVLKKIQFDTFYHEHLRTYSLKSFDKISNKLGMKLVHASFPKRYGGNIRIVLASSDFKVDNKIKNYLKKEEIQIKKYQKYFIKKFKFWKKQKKQEILKLNKKYGPILGKSYPARASLIINLLKLNSSNISNIYEKPGSKKINYFVPGTDIKIISDNMLNSDLPILNFSWHISKEIKNYLKKKFFKGKIIDIL